MQRIISLVPSQTELLYDLGLNDEVIGITKFCIHPQQWYKTKTRIGGTKNINIEKIISLKPTLVLANKEENVKEQVEALQNFTQVYVSDVANFSDAKKMIIEIGSLVNKHAVAASLIQKIEDEFLKLKQISQHKMPAAYLIWHNPYMAAGGDTFINDMMQYAGFENVYKEQLRYPETSAEEINRLSCKVLLLSSEPFPFKQKHIYELQPYMPQTKIVLADGEMFSWYGSRLLLAPGYFIKLKTMLEY